MDKKIKHITQDISHGRDLEMNIPQLFNQLADDYYCFSGIQLAMHYYAFYEAFYDDENTWSSQAKELTAHINKIIKENILENQSGFDREEAIRCVDLLRKDIMKHMNALAIYTDIFQIYEYVLNRLEHRFKEEYSSVNEVEFSKEILRYIFDTEDNLVINEKIKEIIGQLPIRFTKQKYFELLKDSIHAYHGAEKASLESYLYILRTSAMLYQEEGMESFYPGLWEKKEYLSKLSYKDITKEAYEKALIALQTAALTLETETTVYFGLQEIVNEIYALLLCSTYEGMVNTDSEEAENAAFAVIREINDLFMREEKEELSLELMDLFTGIEGVQEELSFEISVMEDSLFTVQQNYKPLVESLMLDKLLHVLLRTQKLLSNSIFINLDDDSKNDAVADEIMIQKEAAALENELTSLFAGQDKMISRAVIANTINKMPVFFNDHKEVMDYVRYSFERCSDVYEKAACVEIINEIMSE